MDRRGVDWPRFLDPREPSPVLQKGSASADLASLLSSFDEMIACEQVDAILKRAVELARERVGLRRVAIFLRDESQGLMRGTWGTDLDGATVDEHAITFQTWQGDREFYEQAARDGVYWTVVENAPIVVHLPAETRVVGRGWVCCTPVRAGRELIGMMFNDAGLTGEQMDEAKQTRGAVLSSLLGSVLEVARRRGLVYECALPEARSSVVVKAVQLLAEEPSLSSEELGGKLQLSASRVARVFKAEMGISLVDYRNRLRLERFNTLLSEPGSSLLEAALQAGFGSYAQFHRVFMASRGTTPGRFVRLRAQRQSDSKSAQRQK